MTNHDPNAKADLQRYLQLAREAVVWKLDGLSEYDVRRPLVPSGTNLLGLVKHLAYLEFGYLGECFDRPPEEPGPWLEDDSDPTADLWATADESREDILGRYRRGWAHADRTIAALELDSPGRVPWWGARGEVTLQRILLHMIAETNRHAGHADIVRELIDGAAGLSPRNSNMPDRDAAAWSAHREKLEEIARIAG